ncbi:hypothetical protein ACFPN4_13325 [Ureibacillus thermophilus]|uniref:hypothetical protein n=1 Tax=Ureibacillus thermophilus TaxID=367743 RepID=UPI003622A420
MSNGKTEEMLTQLIQIVGAIQSEIQGMKAEIQGMKAEIQGMKAEIQGMKAEIQGIKAEIKEIKTEIREIKERQDEYEMKNEERYDELMRAINTIKADQDYIWQKAVRNEREIDKLKKHS